MKNPIRGTDGKPIARQQWPEPKRLHLAEDERAHYLDEALDALGIDKDSPDAASVAAAADEFYESWARAADSEPYAAVSRWSRKMIDAGTSFANFIRGNVDDALVSGSATFSLADSEEARAKQSAAEAEREYLKTEWRRIAHDIDATVAAMEQRRAAWPNSPGRGVVRKTMTEGTPYEVLAKAIGAIWLRCRPGEPLRATGKFGSAVHATAQLAGLDVKVDTLDHAIDRVAKAVRAEHFPHSR